MTQSWPARGSRARPWPDKKAQRVRTFGAYRVGCATLDGRDEGGVT